MDKDTYEQLGLVGKPSRFQKQHRFLVEVDLTASHFRPGKPNYDRVRWSFAKQLGENVRYLLCHLPTGINHHILFYCLFLCAVIAQLGERQTEDLKVPGSIPGHGIIVFFSFMEL